MDTPDISIIIPIFNVSKYLSQCLESIINQTFFNIEIICINDGSTDNCLKILQNYAQKDKRIKIINQKNMGLSAARNSGLKIARAQYVFFIDSDDWIDNNTLEILYDTATETGADLTCCHFSTFAETAQNNNRANEKQRYFDLSLQTADTNFVLANNPLKIHVVVNGKLHKKSIIEKYSLSFPHQRLIHEDEYWAWIYGMHCDKCIYLSKPLYHYREHNESITSTESKSSRALDIIEINCLTANKIHQHGKLSQYISLLEKDFSNQIIWAIHKCGRQHYQEARTRMLKYLEIPSTGTTFKENISQLSKAVIPLSVIIPVYNTAPWLSNCLDSLLNQTTDIFEIICVNDSSTDNSLEILKKYALKDQRIKIINQKHKGTSAARNAGLQQAQGKYVLFVDSDDWYQLDALLKIFINIQLEQAEILIFRLRIFDTQKQNFYSTDYFRLPSSLPHISSHNVQNEIDFILQLPQEACTRCYKKDFLDKHHIKFDEDISVGEDEIFNLNCIQYASKITIMKDDLYNYRSPREGSAMTTIVNQTDNAKISSIFKMLNKIEEFFSKQNNPKYKQALFSRYMFHINILLTNYPIFETNVLYRITRKQLLKNKNIFTQCPPLNPDIQQQIEILMSCSWSKYRRNQIFLKIKKSPTYKRIKTGFNFIKSYFLFPWYVYKIYKMLQKEKSKK